MKTIIMAGGKGTRISSLFPGIPKPLIPISQINPETGLEEAKPVLEWELLSLASQGFTDIILTVGYRAQQIIDYFGDGHNLGINIRYFIEETPLGNAGALFKLRDELTDPFLLLNADAIFEIDFNRMVMFHRDHNALVTLFTHPNSHPYDSGLIIVAEDKSVSAWLTKEDIRPDYYKNRVNAGLHVMDPKVLENAASSIDIEHIGEEVDGKIVKVDLDRQVLKPLCGSRQMFAYDSPEYVKDMGTPERYEAVCRDFASGVVNRKNLKYLQRAIFLDRDGTINKYVGFLRKITDFELLPGVAEAIRLINESGYLAIIVTNQPVIARGEVSVPELVGIHQKMETELGREGAYIDSIYYCPHHPDKGFEGEVVQFKIDCDCRKPKPGMLIKASRDFNIDLKNSWMIGDGKNDVLAGKSAGCKTVLISALGTSDDKIADVADFGQDLTATSLLDAIRQILGK